METMRRTKIVDVLKSTDFGATVNVRGWVRTHRSSKAVDFIALNDGSTIKNVQIVVNTSTTDEQTLRQITTGSCLSVTGTLVESQGKGQSVEIQCKDIKIYGLCGSDYPMQKKGQTFEYMRQYGHLRLRTNTSVPSSASVTTWPSPFTNSSTTAASSISIPPSSQPAMLRGQDRCFR